MMAFKVIVKTNEIVKVLGSADGWVKLEELKTAKIVSARNKDLRELTNEEKEQLQQSLDEDMSVPRALVNPDHSKYVTQAEKTTSGRRVYDIDDEVAAMLRKGGLDEAYFLLAEMMAEDNATEKEKEQIESSLRQKYKGLNPGMQRMAIGNRIRKLVRDA